MILAIAGCAAPGGGSGGGTGGDGSSGQSDGGETSTDSGDTATDGGLDQFEGLPDTFPADVPIIDGDVAFGMDLGTGWSVVVSTPDFGAGFVEASDALKAAGFTAEVETTETAGSLGVFTNEKYTINVTAADTPDYGPAVTYVVVLRG